MNDDQFKSFKDEFKQELLESFNQALNLGRSIDEQRHREHHQFMEIFIAKEERRIEENEKKQQRKLDRNEKIKANVFGWIIITGIGGIGSAVYHFFIKTPQP